MWQELKLTFKDTAPTPTKNQIKWMHIVWIFTILLAILSHELEHIYYMMMLGKVFRPFLDVSSVEVWTVFSQGSVA